MKRPDKTSICLRDEDRATLKAHGMTATEAVRELCARLRGASTPAVVVEVDPGATDPSDNQPDKPPARPHGWTPLNARMVARAATVADAVELVAIAAASGWTASFAAPYVTMVATKGETP